MDDAMVVLMHNAVGKGNLAQVYMYLVECIIA